MDHKRSETQTDIADSEVSRQTVVTNLRFGTSSAERRPALHNLGKKSQSEPGEVYPARLVTFHRNGSKPDLYSKEDGRVTRERIKKTAGKPKKMTHSVQADEDASDPLVGRGLGRSGSPSEEGNSSDLQMKQTCAGARLMSSDKSRNECSDLQKSTSKDEERRNKGTKFKNEHLDGTALSGRMDNMYFEDQANIAGFEFLSEVTRQTVKSNLRFGSSPGERRPDLPHLGNKSQSEPVEDSPTRSVTFHRNGSKTDLSSKRDGSETKERSRKTPDKFRKMTHSVQADGDASDSHGGRYFRRSEFSSKMKYSSDLSLKQTFARLTSSDKSRDECSEPSKCFAGKSSEDDVHEEKHSVSELRARFQGQNEITSVPKIDFHNDSMKESKSKRELFERCWREKENGSRDSWESEDENPFQSGQKRRNKGTKYKNEHLDGTDVSGRMNGMDFGEPADMADTSVEVTRQTVQGNLKFDPSSGEIGAAFVNLGNKFQSEPGEEYPARSMVFYRSRNKPSLASEGDGSETKERVKKIAGGSKKMTHSVQADGGRDVEKSDSPIKFNSLSASVLQPEEIFAGARPRSWRGKENGSKYRMETGDSVVLPQRSKPEHEIPCLENQSGQEKMSKDRKHKKLSGKPMRFPNPKDEEKFKKFINEKHGSLEQLTLLQGSEPLSSKENFQFVDCINRQEVTESKETLDTDKKVKGIKGRENKDVSTAKGLKGRENKDVSAAKGLKGRENKDVSTAKGSKGTENKDVHKVKGLEDRENKDVPSAKEMKGRENKGVPTAKEMKGRENKDVPTSNGKIRNKQNYKTMKQEDEMNPTSMKIQHSLLCVNFSSEGETGSDLGNYLKYRLGDRFKYKFEVQNIQSFTLNGQKNTKVTLSFPSKVVAKKAKECLRQSNRKSATKLLIYFPEERVRELIVLDPYKTESRFEQHLKIIVERATETLALHKSKINEKSEGVMKLEERLEGGKLSLREFESTESEIKATKDKCKELELQKKEFCSYIQCVHDKLEEIKNSVKFETKMNEIRIAFGIECRRLSEALPMYARRSDILSEVKNSQVSVILGETGSGKSTQMTQYLYQAGFAEHGLIACTQPRKIAAVTLATHVASEMASSVGQIVGYQVGMKVKRTKITKILYMTDHILLNECLKDNELKNFSCIIIDEAHERSIFTDLLLGMIKSALKKRPDLKVIITSATINPDVFVSYFGGPEKCPVVRVSGRAYPVELVWLNPEHDQNPFDDYVTKAVNTAVNLHRQNSPADGDILVFLTTPLETEKCCEEFVQKCPTDICFQCLPLHGKLQPEEQQKVFQLNAPNKRKIVFATNSAETSITIPGVKFVVDTGLAKEMRFDPKRNISSLSVYPISQSSAEQRKGRAGRTSPGKCYRLYNEKTYETMEKNTKPEILRVHLGQALLKLLELGVDPLSFDFVESPTQEALGNAMQSLHDIGAVADTKITELGLWISKLPIEPRQGLLLKKGILAGVPMEAIIMASFSGGGGTFYRSGTDEEKRKADFKKIEFCHKGGDILTLLNVYRKWDQVAEKQKGRWCFENFINAKSMKGVRETMKELQTILKRDLGEDIPFEFRPVEDADIILKKLLVEILRQNVCCFLGHEKAGYFNLKNHQHVQVHPSSVLKPLDLKPELIVYEQVLQTYTDFVTSVTPVDETEMMLLPSEVLDIYRHTKDNIRVTLKHTCWAGKKAMKQFVGPLHQNRKETEVRLSAACANRTVVVEANKNTGEIQLYCSRLDEQRAVRMLKDVLGGIIKPMLQNCIDVPVGKSDEGVRAVLGAGGEVINILMPHQYRTIIVKQRLLSDTAIEVSDIKEVFSQFGEITDIKPFMKKNRKDPSNWGTVTFRRDTDAKNALTIASSENRDFEAIPVLPRTNSKISKDFKLKLTWLRRPGKGIAYVKMAWPEDFVTAMAARSVLIAGHIVSIQGSRSKGNHDTTNQLFLRGLRNDILEEDIKVAFKEFLGLSEAETNDRIKSIVVPREDADTSQQMYASLRNRIEEEVLQYASRGSFDIIFVPDPLVNQKCVRYTVFVNFSNPEEGQAALNGMQMDPPSFSVYPVRVTAELETSVAIRKNIYEALKSDIEHVIESFMSQYPDVHIKANTSVSVQGTQARRTKALSGINMYLDTLAGLVEKHLQLKGDGKPCGMMKELIAKYGSDLVQMKEDTGVKTLKLDLRNHKIVVLGDEESIGKMETVIQEICNGLHKSPYYAGSEMPDCPICLCSVEQSNMYRPEYCGHPYCGECIKNQLKSAIQDRSFPVLCAVANCKQPLVIEDFTALIQQGCTTQRDLLKAAVSFFVGVNNSQFRYCITPNCNMVCRVTAEGTPFTCSECQQRICTACHVQYHNGMTCSMYQAEKRDENKIDSWLRKDSTNRKLCPKCSAPIEKSGGCNHMECGNCRIHICWVCLWTFDTGPACYGHMSSAHNSFV